MICGTLPKRKSLLLIVIVIVTVIVTALTLRLTLAFQLMGTR